MSSFMPYVEHSQGQSALTTNSFVQKIRRSKGDVSSIVELVRQADVAGLDARWLDEVLNEAMNNFGPVGVKLAFEEYGELCVRRLQTLCQLDPKEAILFYRFMNAHDIRRNDSRCYIALAEMELQADEREKAIQLLLRGIDTGAQPMAPLEAALAAARDRLHTSRSSLSPTDSTPMRPKSLRYSGCNGVPAPLVGDPVNQASMDGVLQHSHAVVDYVHRSSLDNLSPIVEADSVDHSNLNESSIAFGDGGVTCGHRRHSLPPRISSVAENPSDLMDNQAPVESASMHCVFEKEKQHDSDNSGNSVTATTEVPADADISDSSIGGDDTSASQEKKAKTILVNGVSYLRQRTIGRGGSSKVYLVQGPSGSFFALKRVSTTCSSHFEALANEVTLLQQLKDCPHVIQVFDAQVNAEKGEIFIVMEKGDMDLGRFLQSEKNLGLGEIQILWRQILEAVHVIHKARIVHSDLKPGNFLLVNGCLKIIDFGIAKRMPSETTHISRESSVGTISYMAPEAIKQGSLKLGRSSDIWSLGIMLYQMVYRQVPFAHLEPMQRIFALTDPNMAVTFSSGHRFEGHSEATKASLIDVLQSCLQRDSRRRPSISELLHHPFLQDSLQISRCAFDRAIGAMVAGFCEAARITLQAGTMDDSLEANEDLEIESPCHEQWQLLRDDMWNIISDELHGKLCVRSTTLGADDRPINRPGSTDLLGIAPFQKVMKHWVDRGGSKRQRIAEHSAVVSRTMCGKGASKGVSKGPGKRCAPQSAAVMGSKQSNSAGESAAKVPRSAIHPDLLQQQRACLRKVSPPTEGSGKENVSANVEGGIKTGVSIALQRLRDRRKVVAEESTEEVTQTTKWFSSR